MRISAGKSTVRSIVTALLIPLFFLVVQVSLDCSEANACLEVKHYPKAQHYPKSKHYPPKTRCTNPKPCQEVEPCPEVGPAAPVADAGHDQKKTKTSLFAGHVTLQGSISSGSPNTIYDLEWYGPFGRTTGASPSVQIPQGTYTVSLQAVGCPESSEVVKTKITVSPFFKISANSKKNKIKLKWKHRRKMVRYDIYRAKDDNPSSFEKIGETTSKKTSFRDYSVITETIYLYVVAAIDSKGSKHFPMLLLQAP